jgi:hypothetical protein
MQHALPEAPIIMPDRPPAPAFVSQARTLAMGAGYRAARSFYRGNLILGQAQDDLRIGQIISPKIVLPIWD